MLRRALTLIAGLGTALLLSACRVDVTVDVSMESNGSGVVTVTAVADADVVTAAPGLAEDLRTDDLVAAGWVVDGPTETEDGGLSLSVEHTFATPAEASALLSTLNGASGPFQGVVLSRVETDADVTVTLDGAGRVDAGLAAFADPDLLAAVGATPYAEDIAAASESPSEALSLTFTASLPGTVDSTTSVADDGSLTWPIPLDGTSVPFTTTSTATSDSGGIWSIVATVALGLLVVWLVLSIVFIGYVVYLRRRRRSRRGTGSGSGVRPSRHAVSVAHRYDDVTPDP